MPSSDDQIRIALDLDHLNLPPAIPVVDIDHERYTDSDGEPALRIWVVFADTSEAGDFTGDDVSDLKFNIRESLQSQGVTEFPYIFIVSEDEHASLESAD